MAQQQLIHAGSGSYNKVELEQLRNKITERLFSYNQFFHANEYQHTCTLYQAHM